MVGETAAMGEPGVHRKDAVSEQRNKARGSLSKREAFLGKFSIIFLLGEWSRQDTAQLGSQSYSQKKK